MHRILVRRVAFDRLRVNSHESQFRGSEVLRGLRSERDVLREEGLALSPAHGVVGPEQHPVHAVQQPLEVPGAHFLVVVGDVDDAAGPIQRVEVDVVRGEPVGEEMSGWVDVRAGMRAQRHLGQVVGGPLCELVRGSYRDRWVTRKRGHPGMNVGGDIVDSPHLSPQFQDGGVQSGRH